MAIHESDDSLVLLFGQPGGLAEPIAAALRRGGKPVAHEHPTCSAPSGPRRSAHHEAPGISTAGPPRPIESAIVIVDVLATESLFALGDRRSRRRRKACENDICGVAVATVVSRAAGSVVLVCDARTLSFGRRVRALRWLRHAAHRIAYQSAVNGVDGLVTAYGAVGTDRDVDRVAAGIVTWLSIAEPTARAARSAPSPSMPREADHQHTRRRRRSRAARHLTGAGTLRAA